MSRQKAKMMKKCWMCGAAADSGEHKIKKSLLVALHGEGAYRRSNAVSHVKDGQVRSLQGPGSELIKYTNCLCSACNNHQSQPFDHAYDKFFQFVLRRENEIIDRRVIDFSDVYGEDFELGQRNLYKYLVKLFGCDLSSHDLPVPLDLRELLDKEHFRTRLFITFAVNEDKLLLRDVKDRSAGIGSLTYLPADAGVDDERSYAWSTYFSFLHIYFWYAMKPTGPLGSIWTANSRWIYLGWSRPLSIEQRKELEKSAAVLQRGRDHVPGESKGGEGQ
ncbi:hypothetical protein [Rhizobacter sp. OV335]|jgi:hypothetical protein|uniref:hypothetical protein n=1 Tax=Rhizobacter sp. OV335 TaxID=1500264 RepID=UPI000914CD10|nr:hypothetical protein [Rhizobacter sp. OV335]SHN25691.1 hypothetical protein SAMN02787076_04515 [Rhizobacter sp. OV335]